MCLAVCAIGHRQKTALPSRSAQATPDLGWPAVAWAFVAAAKALFVQRRIDFND